MMENDYVKYIVEPYAVCPDKLCNRLGMRLFRITISEYYVGLFSDCKYCGTEVRESITKTDMEHHMKLYLEKREAGDAFRRFVLGVNNRNLFMSNYHYEQYNKFFMSILKKGRKKIFNRNGKKITIPNLGQELEQYLDN
jgi:hypothetical protein